MASIPDIWSEESLVTAESIISSGAGAHYLQLQEWLKVVLWLGATTFYLALLWKTTEFLPPVAILPFWTVAELVTLIGFHPLFIHGVPNTNGIVDIMKAALWVLATALNIIITWRTMKILPTTLAIFVYAKIVFIAIWGFYTVVVSRVPPSAAIPPC